jgi:hypothetical protein
VSMGKGDAPAPPDYAAAARAQGGANVQSAIATALLNRPREVTPYGTRDWQQIGTTQIPGADGNPAVDIPNFQSTMSLTPLGQQRFDQEQRMISSLGNTAEAGIGRVGESFSKPFSFSGADDLQNQAEEAYMGRMDKQFARDDESLRTRLATAGIDPGGEAADREFGRLSEAKNDARTRAVLNAFQMRPQMLQEETAIRNQPLNELNALRSGSQVQTPQFQNFSPTSVTAAPVFQGAQASGDAAMQSYNAGAMQDAAFTQGLFSLGGAAMGAPISKTTGKPWWMG